MNNMFHNSLDLNTGITNLNFLNVNQELLIEKIKEIEYDKPYKVKISYQSSMSRCKEILNWNILKEYYSEQLQRIVFLDVEYLEHNFNSSFLHVLPYFINIQTLNVNQNSFTMELLTSFLQLSFPNLQTLYLENISFDLLEQCLNSDLFFKFLSENQNLSQISLTLDGNHPKLFSILHCLIQRLIQFNLIQTKQIMLVLTRDDKRDLRQLYLDMYFTDPYSKFWGLYDDSINIYIIQYLLTTFPQVTLTSNKLWLSDQSIDYMIFNDQLNISNTFESIQILNLSGCSYERILRILALKYKFPNVTQLILQGMHSFEEYYTQYERANEYLFTLVEEFFNLPAIRSMLNDEINESMTLLPPLLDLSLNNIHRFLNQRLGQLYLIKYMFSRQSERTSNNSLFQFKIDDSYGIHNEIIVKYRLADLMFVYQSFFGENFCKFYKVFDKDEYKIEINLSTENTLINSLDIKFINKYFHLFEMITHLNLSNRQPLLTFQGFPDSIKFLNVSNCNIEYFSNIGINIFNLEEIDLSNNPRLNPTISDLSKKMFYRLSTTELFTRSKITKIILNNNPLNDIAIFFLYAHFSKPNDVIIYNNPNQRKYLSVPQFNVLEYFLSIQYYQKETIDENKYVITMLPTFALQPELLTIFLYALINFSSIQVLDLQAFGIIEGNQTINEVLSMVIETHKQTLRRFVIQIKDLEFESLSEYLYRNKRATWSKFLKSLKSLDCEVIINDIQINLEEEFEGYGTKTKQQSTTNGTYKYSKTKYR